MNASFGEFFDRTANEFEVASNPSEYIPETPPPEPTYGTINELHDTPRTREAVKRAGLSWAECQRRDYKSFFINGENLPEAQEMRSVHYETRRLQKVDLVMRERVKLIRERTEEKASPSSFRALQS